jgi:3'(2'), 5'-bisphosphate nucleotidase
MPSASSHAGLIDQLTSVASRAAAAILAIRTPALDPRTKSDLSPVTAADHASEAIILEEIARLLPGVPIISEEASAATTAPAMTGSDFVLVDPLDGTRELMAGRDEFTINLALVVAGRPTLGVIAAPAFGTVWRTAPRGDGAQRLRLTPGMAANAATDITAIRTRPLPRSGVIAAVSRSHFDPDTDAFLKRLGARYGDIKRLAIGSAIKLCRVAEGEVDIYPRLAPTHLWDVAAGDAIITAAGGTITTADGLPLSYGIGADCQHVPGFVAWADPAAATASW